MNEVLGFVYDDSIDNLPKGLATWLEGEDSITSPIDGELDDIGFPTAVYSN